MNRRERALRWIPPLAGAAIFAASVADGQSLTLVWLPAVLLAAVWPPRGSSIRSCLRRLSGRS